MVHIDKDVGLTITIPEIKDYEELYNLQNNLLKLLLLYEYSQNTDGMGIYTLAGLLQSLLPTKNDFENIKMHCYQAG